LWLSPGCALGYFAIATWVLASVVDADHRADLLDRRRTGEPLPGLTGKDPAVLTADTYWRARRRRARHRRVYFLLRSRVGLVLTRSGTTSGRRGPPGVRVGTRGCSSSSSPPPAAARRAGSSPSSSCRSCRARPGGVFSVQWTPPRWRSR